MDSGRVKVGRLLWDTLQNLYNVWINSNNCDVIKESQNLKCFLNRKDALDSLQFRDFGNDTTDHR